MSRKKGSKNKGNVSVTSEPEFSAITDTAETPPIQKTELTDLGEAKKFIANLIETLLTHRFPVDSAITNERDKIDLRIKELELEK